MAFGHESLPFGSEPRISVSTCGAGWFGFVNPSHLQRTRSGTTHVVMSVRFTRLSWRPCPMRTVSSSSATEIPLQIRGNRYTLNRHYGNIVVLPELLRRSRNLGCRTHAYFTRPLEAK
jgi:hypothetical protein